MPVETPSLFAQVIKDHLDLKERNSTLDPQMPIDRYRSDDPFENHPLFKTEEQARLEETMDGVEPDFDASSIESALPWPGEDATAENAVSSNTVTSGTASTTDTVSTDAPATASIEDSGFWAVDRARDFDWGD